MSLVTEMVHVPGSVFIDPTGTASANHGTYIGETEAGFTLTFNRQISPVLVHEHGEIPQDYREIDAGATVGVTLVRWNEQTKKLLFGDSRVTNDRVEIPGSTTPGTGIAAHRFLFVPTNSAGTDNESYKCAWIAHNGMARIMPGENIEHKLDTKSVFPIEILCTPAGAATGDSMYNYRSFGMGSIAGLTVDTDYPG